MGRWAAGKPRKMKQYSAVTSIERRRGQGSLLILLSRLRRQSVHIGNLRFCIHGSTQQIGGCSFTYFSSASGSERSASSLLSFRPCALACRAARCLRSKGLTSAMGCLLDGARSSIRGCGRDPASSVDGGIDDWSNFCSSRSLCLHRPPHTAFPLFSSSRCYARHTLPAYTITSTQTEATIDPSNKYRELGYGAVAEVTANWGYFTWTTTLSCQYILPPRVSMLPKTWTIVVDDNGVTTATW